MARNEAARLKRYLQTLPQADRYILLLSYADGLTITEVAVVLDLSETTVARRLEVLRREAESALRADRVADEPVAADEAAESFHAFA